MTFFTEIEKMVFIFICKHRTPIAKKSWARKSNIGGIAIINKWAGIKLKSFCIKKETLAEWRGKPTLSDKIFTSYSYEREVI
jgi:hypothetical protein